MKCEYCGQHSPDNELICEYCGAPLPVEYTANKKIRYKYVSPHCTGCGRKLDETEAFCRECHTISPVVSKTFIDNPTKSGDAFVRTIHSYHGESYTDCPHCGNTYEETIASFSPQIESPIHICEKCHQAYIRPYKYEWSVISLKSKAFAIFFSTKRWYAFLLAIWGIMLVTFEESLWGIPLGALLLAIVHLIFDRKAVRLSQKRLEQNPDYPQILVDMGYTSKLHKTYHHLLKFPPLTLKEVLKEAFTFD